MAKYSLIDSPIRGMSDDALNIGDYVAAMAQFIQFCDTPMTIGIQGDWGIGKTSFLNMVQENLGELDKGSGRHKVVYVNTWQYSQFNQESMLSLLIMRRIIDEIEAQAKNVSGADAWLKKYGPTAKKVGLLLAAIGNQVVKQQVGLDLMPPADRPGDAGQDMDFVSLLTAVKAEFEQLVQSANTIEGAKVVIMIDDLDRIRPIRALEILEAIKVFLDVEGCVFLVAVDYSVVQRGMEAKLGAKAQELQGRSYFDKIIQVPFSMPVTSYKIDDYIMRMLGWQRIDGAREYVRQPGAPKDDFLSIRDQKLDSDTVELITNLTRTTVGTNPRSLKRLVNYATLLRIVARRSHKNEVRRQWTLDDAIILYALASMQLAWPEVFEVMSSELSAGTLESLQDYEYLETNGRLAGLFARVHNPDEVKANIAGFFDEFVEYLDTNRDGRVSPDEVKRVKNMISDANMSVIHVSNIEEMFAKFEEMIRDASSQHSKSKASAEARRSLALLSHQDSKWVNSKQLKLLPSGKRYLTVLWGRQQIGSLVTTQQHPFRFYLKCSAPAVWECDASLKPYLHDDAGVAHYGCGNCRVDLEAIAACDAPVEVMNRVHAVAMPLMVTKSGL